MKRIYFAVFAIYVFQIIFPMDKPMNILSIDEQALGLVVNYLFHRKTILSVALVSKHQNKCVLNTANNRKKNQHVLSHVLPNVVLLGSLKDRYSTAYGSAYKKTWKSGLVSLMMDSCEIGRVPKMHPFSHFMFQLPHKPVPFLNEKNEWCFDGCGKTRISMGGLVGGVVEYEAVRYNLSSQEGLPIIAKMATDCGGFFYSKAINFRNYPSLFRSILGVKKAVKKLFQVEDLAFFTTEKRIENYLEVDFKCVVLKDDWAESEKFLEQPDFLLFENHPTLKRIIEKHYKKQCDQQNREDINNWYDCSCEQGEHVKVKGL